jgi:GNAT superfamily N-acetyltransferase
VSPTKQPKEPKPVDRNALKRESAGRYSTPDGRFEVEQNSGRWMISDTAETNDFGLPLIRGPFATLDEVRDAIRDAREGAAPTSPLAGRVPRSGSAGSATGGGVEPRKAPTRASADRKPEPDAKPAKPPEPAPIEIRRLEPGDDGVVRKLAALSGLASATCGPLRGAKESDIGPIDRESARRLLARADVHIVVALEDDAPIGHMLAFELPRLRDDDPVLVIDEVAVADDRRREGIASRLAKALFDVAVVGGVKHVIGFAASDDRAVRAFYRSIGGEPAKDESGVFEFEIGKSS